MGDKKRKEGGKENGVVAEVKEKKSSKESKRKRAEEVAEEKATEAPAKKEKRKRERDAGAEEEKADKKKDKKKKSKKGEEAEGERRCVRRGALAAWPALSCPGRVAAADEAANGVAEAPEDPMALDNFPLDAEIKDLLREKGEPARLHAVLRAYGWQRSAERFVSVFPHRRYQGAVPYPGRDAASGAGRQRPGGQGADGLRQDPRVHAAHRPVVHVVRPYVRAEGSGPRAHGSG